MPALAWILIVVGVLLVIFGTLCAMKVRRTVLDDSESPLDWLAKTGFQTISMLLYEYDEPDKPLMLLGFLGRVLGMVGLLWGVLGLVWA